MALGLLEFTCGKNPTVRKVNCEQVEKDGIKKYCNDAAQGYLPGWGIVNTLERLTCRTVCEAAAVFCNSQEAETAEPNSGWGGGREPGL